MPKRTSPRDEQRIVVRAVRPEKPDLKALRRALLRTAMARLDAEDRARQEIDRVV